VRDDKDQAARDVPAGMDVGSSPQGGGFAPPDLPRMWSIREENGRKAPDFGEPADVSSLDDLDDDGYPTALALKRIRRFGSKGDTLPDWNELLRYCQKLWRYPDYVQENERRWEFHTGGWSGNESIIEALQDNGLFWILCWVMSSRGGHFVFEVRP